MDAATKGTTMDVLDGIVEDAKDERYASRGVTATRVGDAVIVAKNGVVWDVMVAVGGGSYATWWPYDHKRTDWRMSTFDDVEDSPAMRGSMALESAAYDRP